LTEDVASVNVRGTAHTFARCDVALSAVESLNAAFEHTKQQLFSPFRFGQWTRLAVVGLFAGEMGSGSGCHVNIPTHAPHQRDYLAVSNLFPSIDPLLLVPLIIAAVIAIPILWLLFLYVSSHMRFVLFDSVIAKNCLIRRMWRARRGPALQYFVWQIVFSLVTLGAIAVILGIPALIAFTLGWFTEPREHLPGLILAGVLVFFVFFFAMVLAICVYVFTKDFVVPQMALEDVSAFEGWRRLLPMLEAEKGKYAGYAGMKIVMAIGAGVAIGIAGLIVLVVLLIPVGGLGLISVLAGQAAGVTWNVFTITLAIVGGCVFLLVVFYLISLIAVPAIVFFPAYSIYFFAARYRPLANLIYPPPVPPIARAGQPSG
jgi:hypothetical protein